MGEFRVPLSVADAAGVRFEQLEALVDTGATFTWLPQSFLRRLGHEPTETWDFVLADGRRVQYGIKWVMVRLNGGSHISPVVFGEEGTEPLLGVFTLEGSRLGVDAVNQRLIPTPANLKGYRG